MSAEQILENSILITQVGSEPPEVTVPITPATTQSMTEASPGKHAEQPGLTDRLEYVPVTVVLALGACAAFARYTGRAS